MISGMFQYQSVHIEHYDGQCRVGNGGLFVEYRLLSHLFIFGLSFPVFYAFSEALFKRSPLSVIVIR